MRQEAEQANSEPSYNRCEKDTSYFWKVWQEQKSNLYQVCLKIMGGSVEEAKDALSTAMINAVENYKKNFPSIYNINGWLFRVTQNVCFDILRKRKKEIIHYKYQKSVEETLQCISSIDDDFSDNNNVFDSPEEILEQNLILDQVCKSIKKLPVRLREPTVLRFFLGMSYRDIALQCNLSNANARKCVQKARQILANEFKGSSGNIDLSFLNFKNIFHPSFLTSFPLAEMTRESEKILNRDIREINGSYTASNVIQFYLPSGIEKSIYIFLKSRLTRYKIKLKTLKKYIDSYPGSWKKRMELAELFFAVGNWTRAILEFHLALRKHPQSLEAWLCLAEMHRGIEQKDEAVKALEAAIPFARKKATRHHIRGIIELCHHRYNSASTAFSYAASLEKKMKYIINGWQCLM